MDFFPSWNFTKFWAQKVGEKKILVKNTTCQIYERTRNLGEKNPHFGHNKVLGGSFWSAFYSFENFLEPCYQLMLDYFLGDDGQRC
jgi:hypothetical protein